MKSAAALPALSIKTPGPKIRAYFPRVLLTEESEVRKPTWIITFKKKGDCRLGQSQTIFVNLFSLNKTHRAVRRRINSRRLLLNDIRQEFGTALRQSPAV